MTRKLFAVFQILALCASAALLLPQNAYATTCGTGSNITFTDIGGGYCRGYIVAVGSSNVTLPTDWVSSNNTVEAIGGGGDGGVSAAGGGGGEYRRIRNFSASGGASIPYTIGAGGGNKTNGGDTTFNTSSLIAKGGSGAVNNTGAAGGTGGTGADANYDGGAGGSYLSGFGTAGGGGAGGKLGVGGKGGDDNAAGANQGAGGGGGNSGGSAGTTATSDNGGAGGNNSGGSGGGAGDTSGAASVAGTSGGGGGGGGGFHTSGSNGGGGTEWDGSHGSGGGGGGSGNNGSVAGNGGLYGGGGGSNDTAITSGSGAQGVIVIVYGIGVPDAPTNLTATKSGSDVNLAWTAPNDHGSGITSYSIYRDPISSPTFLLTTITGAATTSATYTDVGATTHRYYYRVVATNANGSSPYSSEVISAGKYSLAKPANNLGLVLYWSLDDATTTKATDFSGNGNTGTLQSGPTWVNGKRGQAVSFDGVNDYVSSTKQFSNPQTFTVSVWFKTTVASGHKLVGFEDAQTGEAGGSYDRQIYMGTDGKIYFGWYPGGVTLVISSATLNDGTWHHAVATHDGTTGTLYIDGVSQGTNTGAPQAYSGWWRLGSYKTLNWTNATDGYFTGTLDDVRIYNRALSASEVKALYANNTAGAARANASTVTLQNGTTLGPANGLVGHWTFDGADIGSTVVDRSGQNNNGYFYNGATSSATTIGKLGQALNFNGTTNYVNAGKTASENISGALTVSAWVNSATPSSGCVSPSGCEIIANANAGDTDEQYNFLVQNGVVGFCQQNSSNFECKTGAIKVATSTWTHVVVTRNAANTSVHFYVNGVDDPSGWQGTAAPATSRFGNTVIGRYGDLNQGYFPGKIDDVRLYNRDLTAAEVKQLYKLGTVTVKQ